MKNDDRDLVVMSIETYENSFGKQELYETLFEADLHFNNGKKFLMVTKYFRNERENMEVEKVINRRAVHQWDSGSVPCFKWLMCVSITPETSDLFMRGSSCNVQVKRGKGASRCSSY